MKEFPDLVFFSYITGLLMAFLILTGEERGSSGHHSQVLPTVPPFHSDTLCWPRGEDRAKDNRIEGRKSKSLVPLSYCFLGHHLLKESHNASQTGSLLFPIKKLEATKTFNLLTHPLNPVYKNIIKSAYNQYKNDWVIFWSCFYIGFLKFVGFLYLENLSGSSSPFRCSQC